MSTNEYIKHVKKEGWQSFDRKLWQRSFYEHIIRDGEEYEHAVLYIKRNPERWGEDKHNE
jgi:REP element-mobilizing transposase RayT